MKRRSVVRFAVAVSVLLVASLISGPAPAARPDTGQDRGYGPQDPPLMAFAWTQLTPGGTQVRYATPEADCPSLVVTVGGQSSKRQMALESRLDRYPTSATLCALRVERAVTAARIDTGGVGVPVHPDPFGVVPLPDWTRPNATKPRPENIAVIGDTGCRIPDAGPMQDCTPPGWPLLPVTDSAAVRPVPPDLVVHVGDYLYRTRPSRQPTPLCGATGLGNNAHTWGCLVTDFFLPAENLLGQAPFVFVRGNHENCGRSGEVWFRYLATTPSTTACSGSHPEDFTPPERIDAGTLGLIVMDTSCASDEGSTCDHGARLATYTAQFNEINNNLVRGGDNFLLSHTPLWAVHGRTASNNPRWIDELLDDAVRASGAHQLDQRITVVLSGHVHLYQALDFGVTTAARRPPQLTVGASGTTLDRQDWVDGDMIGKDVDGEPLGQLITRREFGYAVLRDLSPRWNVRFFDQAGTVVAGTDCDLGPAQFVGCS
ncbi:metallophosphoesterase family protein [Asanoa ishikariensis]|uniref:metallophosphoesterase family protein n=1 Tax=Asanoa ishikariensis TaxID=137265 RepID=UPI00115F8655|nr:metallophosphoesterase [Asanoa ishikariensis]